MTRSQTGTPLTDDKIIELAVKAYEQNHFQGLVGWHFYNEPMLQINRILSLMERIRARVPAARFLLWSNGTIPCNDPRMTMFSLANVSDYFNNEPLLRKRFNALKNLNIGSRVFDDRLTSPMGAASKKRCLRPLVEIPVDGFGNVHLCCQDWKNEIPMGNVWSTSWEEILANRRAIMGKICGPVMSDDAPDRCLKCAGRLDGLPTFDSQSRERAFKYVSSLGARERNLPRKIDLAAPRPAPLCAEVPAPAPAPAARPAEDAADAIQKLRTEVRLQPSNAGLRLKLGMSLLQTGDLNGALAELTEVRGLEPANVEAAKATASLLIQLNRLPEAALALKGVIQLHPTDVEALRALAACFRSVGELDAARVTDQRILELEAGPAATEAGRQMVAGGEKKQPEPCPVCRQPAAFKLSKGGHDYFGCTECGAVFTPAIDPGCLRTENSGRGSRHNPFADFWRLNLVEWACDQPVRRMVDFGCGGGEFGALVRQRGIQCDGIDQNTTLQLRDLPDGSLDALTMVEAIEHLYEPHAIFQEFKRVLRPGGAVLVESSFVNGQDLASWPYLDPSIGHCTVHTRRSMALLAASHGFALRQRGDHIFLLTKPLATPMAPEASSSEPVQVSVVIPVFNKAEFTRKCLAKLAAVASSIPHEIIVVDNGSTDETESFCRGWAERHAQFRYCRLPQNFGFGRACNHGAKQARGEWVVFLNNDTEPQPGWLEAAVARLRSDPAIGIVGAKLLYPDRTVQHCGIEFFFNTNLAQAVWPSHRYMGAAGDDPRANAAGEVSAVTGACLFVSVSLFESVNGFSLEYPMYFEDTDLCFKVRQAGRTIFYEPKCVVIHYESQSSANRERVDALNRESAGIFFKKWPAQIDKFVLEASIEKTEGRFTYFRQNVLPPTQEVPPNLACALARLFQHVGPFYMHFGGAGDAVLLLATFLDQHPDAQV
ncbi:MAG TPA: glycosyltransferase, partial [Candidatus Acidoferrales bacterium]|nr:glycosyltransferase [Candidatus Acidoferrales bacterium]